MLCVNYRAIYRPCIISSVAFFCRVHFCLCRFFCIVSPVQRFRFVHLLLMLKCVTSLCVNFFCEINFGDRCNVCYSVIISPVRCVLVGYLLHYVYIMWHFSCDIRSRATSFLCQISWFGCYLQLLHPLVMFCVVSSTLSYISCALSSVWYLPHVISCTRSHHILRVSCVIRRHACGVHGRGGASVRGRPPREEVRGDGGGQLLPVPRRCRRHSRRHSQG